MINHFITIKDFSFLSQLEIMNSEEEARQTAVRSFCLGNNIPCELKIDFNSLKKIMCILFTR